MILYPPYVTLSHYLKRKMTYPNSVEKTYKTVKVCNYFRSRKSLRHPRKNLLSLNILYREQGRRPAGLSQYFTVTKPPAMKKNTILSAFLFFLLALQVSVSRAQPEEPIVSASFFVPAETMLFYQLGDIRVPIQRLQYGTRNDIICINVHDNERTSVEAAREILQSTGGTLIRIENRKQRLIRFRFRGVGWAFDPNRMFSRVGIEQSLMENNGRKRREVIDEIEKFASFILQQIPDSAQCIVALHNNTNDAFSVLSYKEGHDRERDAREVSHQEGQDIDDIILTTDEALFRKMGELGYNAIWQDNENAKRDGSLSIWSGENGRRYINIETQHGKLGQYVEMMGKLMEWLNVKSH